MSAPAFSVPTWATSAPPAAAVLPAQLRLDGYAGFDIPTADGLNRWRYEVGAWLSYLNTEGVAPFALEHYETAGTDAYAAAITAGSHGAVVADSLTIRGSGTSAGQGGTLTFRDAGRTSDNTAKIAVGAALPGTVILQFGRSGSATKVEAELDGGVWRSTLQGSAVWAMEVSSGSDQTFYVRNTGAGVANLDVDGAATINGVASFITSIQGTSGTLTCTDQFAAQGGLAAEFDSDNCAFRYLGASRQTFEQDISPFAGSWMVADTDSTVTGTYEFETSTTPPCLNVTAGTVVAHRALSFAHNTDNVPSSTARRLITRVKIRYYRAAAGDTVTFKIVRVKRDGSAAENALLTYDEVSNMTTTGAWTLFDSGAIAATDFDPATYYYFARFILNRVNTMQIADVTLEWEARHVEAAPL